MPDAPPVDALFFDIGNVLVRFDLAGLLKDFAWSPGSSAWKVARLVWSRRLVDAVERGQLDGPGLHDAVRAQTGFAGDYDAFRRVWCGHFRLDGATSVLFRRLARRRPAYLLSNTNALHWEFIRRRYAFAREAKGAVLSCAVGARKPEKAIYEAAVAAAGVPAERCLFIDDLEANVRGAKSAGLRAVRFKNAAQLRRELESYGVR
jgi:putative hydrolase of the HAD superfamily